jgi:hypothetical protein
LITAYDEKILHNFISFYRYIFGLAIYSEEIKNLAAQPLKFQTAALGRLLSPQANVLWATAREL